MIRAFTVGFFLVWTLGFVQPATPQNGTHVLIVGPDLSEYKPFTPPDRYRVIMRTAERCTKKHGDFDEIVWLAAPGLQFWPPKRYYADGRRNAQSLPNIGMWQQASEGRDTIVIATGWRDTDWVIKHELVHFLLQRDHYEDKGTDDEVWGRKCRAKWGFLDARYDSRPGVTSYYGDPGYEMAR